jgi:hypothetical protein
LVERVADGVHRFSRMEEIWEGHLSFEPEEVVALDDEQVLAAVRTGGREGSEAGSSSD